ncbi:MAG: hypothetical protein Q9166_007242 [cf. Caloplaca sp. 2 TL-2023]
MPSDSFRDVDRSSVVQRRAEDCTRLECVATGLERQAQALIPTNGDPIHFGQRGRAGVDLQTPWRWISCSYLDLREAAEEMMEVCLEYKDRPEGAIATNIGADGRLTLTMKSYVPNVTCRGPLILSGSTFTDEILRRMPAVSPRIAFGRRGVPGVRVVLPLRYTAINRVLKAQLVATVDVTTTSREQGYWYDIWAATVAIAGMCVRDGKGGSATLLGDNGKIMVTVAEKPI